MARNRKCVKTYTYADGETGSHTQPDAPIITFDFVDGATEVVEFAKLPANVLAAAARHGISQKLGDTYAQHKNPEDAYDAFMAVLERLQAGEWMKERESAGPRTSMVLEAVVAVMEKAGASIDDAKRKELAELLQDKDARETAMAQPKVKAAYEAIKAQRAAERAEKAAAAADGDEGGTLFGVSLN